MVPLYRPYMPELPELDNILHSGALAYGKYSIGFEEALKNYFDNDYLITTSSFHMTIAVVISVLDIKFGDEIIASPMACLASTQPFASSGIKIVWADVDPATGTLDPKSTELKITSKTKLILHNHFCGFPGYIDEINEIGKKNGIPVVDDGIEAFGSLYKNKKIGKCGTDITIFSFTAVRIPNTIDGGAVLFRDKTLYENSKLARDCGIDRSIFRDDIGEINPNCDINLKGYSATMSNVNGYIGIQQMKGINTLLLKHRERAGKWDGFIQKSGEYNSLKRTETLPNYWVYGLLAQNKRETILKFRKLGFYASGVHINNNIYSVFGDKSDLKGVNEFYRRFVALPCGWWMNE